MTGRSMAVGVAVAGALVLALFSWDRLPTSPFRADGKPIRVEVLNGSGVRHAGFAVAQALREKGFDVVDIRNAERSDYDETVVLDRVGVPEYALAVASEIGVGQALEERNGSLLLEVTVILGRDRGRNWAGSL